MGSISTNGSSTSYNTTSDYRLKATFGEAEAGDFFDKVKVYDGAFLSFLAERKPMFLAHELQDIAAYAVRGEKDAVDEKGNIAPQQVDHSALVPALVAEVKSLRARIKVLEDAIK